MTSPRNFKVIEWPLDASSEWLLATFGERVDIFVRQVAEISAEQKANLPLQPQTDLEDSNLPEVGCG